MTVKYPKYTSTQAAARAKAKVGKPNAVGMCLHEVVVNIFDVPPPWGWGGNRQAWAYNFWLNAVAHGKVVKTSDPDKIPAGAMVFWTPRPGATTVGGKAGHVAVGAGGGYCYSTDLPVSGRWGKIKISDVARLWGKTLLGYIVVTGDGYTLTDKPATPATPPAPKPDSVTFHLGNLNVCRNRITTTGKNWTSPGGFHIQDVSKGLAWSERVKLIPGIAAGVSMLTTQETAQYVDRDLIIKNLGSAWGGILHGDGDLSTAVFADIHKRKHIKDWSFTTTGPNHKQATAVQWEDIGTGINFIVSTSHLIDPAQGSDTLRGQQAKAWIKATEEVAGDLPIIFSGDVNLPRASGDPVGKAFAKYHEAEVVAKVKTHNDWGTTNQLKAKPGPGRRVDRIFVSPGIVVNSIDTVFGAPATDHNLVAVSLTVPR